MTTPVEQTAPAKEYGSGVLLYLQPRLLIIFILGFASGLPLALSSATLSFWLAEVGIALTAIGLFALVGTPYNFKFVWAPFIDRIPVPLLTRLLGRRRSWMLVIHQPAGAVRVGECHQPPGHFTVGFRVTHHPGERIKSVGIQSGSHDHALRPEPL